MVVRLRGHDNNYAINTRIKWSHQYKKLYYANNTTIKIIAVNSI